MIFLYPLTSEDRAQFFTVNIQDRDGAERNYDIASLPLGLKFQVLQRVCS